jgi:Spy/CpxP family protein refolding chaperone
MNTSLKRLLSLTGLLLLAVPFLQAADEPVGPPAGEQPKHERRGPGGPGAMMKQAAKELGLSAEQEAKWKEIAQQERAALEAIRNDESIAKQDKRAKAMEANQGFAAQRRAVLNAEQQQKFDDMRAKMRERGERGPRGPKPDKNN